MMCFSRNEHPNKCFIKHLFLIFVVFFISGYKTIIASPIEIVQSSIGQFIIVVDHQLHQDYGLKYPITYRFKLDSGNNSLTVWKKARQDDPYEMIPDRADTSFFNAVEAARLDENDQIVYVSVSFSELTDSLFLRMLDQQSQPVQAHYTGITAYYDNRKAAVTATIDDVAYWFNPHFVTGVRKFQQYKIWITLALITGGCDLKNTWSAVQDLLNRGYTEASAHSQTHPYVPYGNQLESEVSGCIASIKEHLILPPLFRAGEHEYVYTWICPYGQHDDVIDSLLGEEKILVNRLYEPPGYYRVADWDGTFGLFQPILPSREMGTTEWESYATTNLDTLNAHFDKACALNGVYHLMLHPQTVDWTAGYADQHLAYISQRKDVWYTALGHLYLYRLMYINQPKTITSIDRPCLAVTLPENYQLFQNYPNPFNPGTTIKFYLPDQAAVAIKIYDMLGREIRSLSDQTYSPGTHTVRWDGTDESGNNVTSGIYFYQLESKYFFATNKCLLLR